MKSQNTQKVVLRTVLKHFRQLNRIFNIGEQNGIIFPDITFVFQNYIPTIVKCNSKLFIISEKNRKRQNEMKILTIK